MARTNLTSLQSPIRNSAISSTRMWSRRCRYIQVSQHLLTRTGLTHTMTSRLTKHRCWATLWILKVMSSFVSRKGSTFTRDLPKIKPTSMKSFHPENSRSKAFIREVKNLTILKAKSVMMNSKKPSKSRELNRKMQRTPRKSTTRFVAERKRTNRQTPLCPLTTNLLMFRMKLRIRAIWKMKTSSLFLAKWTIWARRVRERGFNQIKINAKTLIRWHSTAINCSRCKNQQMIMQKMTKTKIMASTLRARTFTL